jgi:hypothetical protein
VLAEAGGTKFGEDLDQTIAEVKVLPVRAMRFEPKEILSVKRMSSGWEILSWNFRNQASSSAAWFREGGFQCDVRGRLPFETRLDPRSSLPKIRGRKQRQKVSTITGVTTAFPDVPRP